MIEFISTAALLALLFMVAGLGVKLQNNRVVLPAVNTPRASYRD